MKLFVTGGTGFVGSHFLNHAHRAGHEVLALSRVSPPAPRVPLEREPEWLPKPMDAVTPEDLEGCQCVVHLAVHSANVPYDTLEACIEQNVLAPLRLFRTAAAAGIRRFIVAGTCFEYGTAADRYHEIPADAPLEPVNSYPASKAAATMAFRALACEASLELLILRIFQVYGEGEAPSRFWPALRKAALAGEDFKMSSGLQVRDFIHVGQVAQAFVAALDRDDLVAGEPRIEHVATGEPCSLIDFARREWQRFGATGELQPGHFPMRPNEVMRIAGRLPG